jgi:hypothetical protein
MCESVMRGVTHHWDTSGRDTERDGRGPDA